MNTSLLLWNLLFSSIGLGFFLYGKKQKAVILLFSGLGLMIHPYFVSNTLLLAAIGVALMALPYFVRIEWYQRMKALPGFHVDCFRPHIKNGDELVWIQ